MRDKIVVKLNNFLELDTVAEANRVNLEDYVWLDRFSAERRKYCFKVRQRK